MAVAEGLSLAADMCEQASRVHRIEASRMRAALRHLDADLHDARAEEAIGLAAAFLARAAEEDTDPNLVSLGDVQAPWWRRLREWLGSG